MDTATTTASTAPPTTATAGPILAIDLGKYKSVACAYAGEPAARFESQITDSDHLRQLFAKNRHGAVAIEAGRSGPVAWDGDGRYGKGKGVGARFAQRPRAPGRVPRAILPPPAASPPRESPGRNDPYLIVMVSSPLPAV
jgi:hypothetical protein